ncbi:MAG: permease [Chloroflexi bacterium]|nr:permease [Chloroflexota bacterium]
MQIWLILTKSLQSGLGNLAAYLAAHVLLCLLPAFFIAGGLTALVPKEAVTRYLGPKAPKIISYPAAAIGGFLLAVCSCTIMPLFAGIYKKGAGLGPAITFLFVGPAINILALAYTGVTLGMDLAVARIVLSVAFGMGIGLIMALIFRRSEAGREAANGEDPFSQGARIPRTNGLFLLLMAALLIVGTLQVPLLTRSYADFILPLRGVEAFQATLNRWVPFDASRGEEGVSVQGAILIGLLIVIAGAAWLGLNKVDEGYNRWTWLALGLIALTLLVAALRLVPSPEGLTIQVTGKFVGVLLALGALWYTARRYLDEFLVQEWLWETWRFVKQIMPLLFVGVFAVGVIRGFIRPEWIESLAGRNNLLANIVGVLFGVFMYFPTLVEVPIAKMFLSLGMHRGPLLAYLMADPELSLQSILITAGIIGKVKAWTYVAWVALFSVLAGLLYGAFVDGVVTWHTARWALLGLVALGALWVCKGRCFRRRRPRQATLPTQASE